ncbi:MAG: FG-GAP-like repeat-containing protein [Bacteroidota bacterium]|nr:FG-GAP-like repeat-containing protein [Bacteroidota bacterium]
MSIAKYLSKTFIHIYFLTLAVNCTNLYAQKILLDKYGRQVNDSLGNHLNYSNFPIIHDSEIVNKHTNSRLSNGTTTIIGDNSKNCVPAFKRGVLGGAIGVNSMNTIDIDKDGIIEIVCSATQNSNFYNGSSPAFWQILEYSQSNNNYKQVWLSKSYEDGITCIRVFDPDGDRNYNIYVGTNKGNIDIYSGSTLSIVGSLNTGSNSRISQMVYEDIDNDQIPDFGVSSGNNIYLYNITTNGLSRTLNITASDFAVGNVDSDSKNELVVLSGEVYEITNSTNILQWRVDLNTDSHHSLKLSDIDNDGKKEVIMAFKWQSIKVYDADIQSLKYEIVTSIDIASLITKDINNDNLDEIIYGDAQWGGVHCINAQTNSQIWQINNPGHATMNLQIADFDMNDTLDVIWVGGITSTGPDNIYIADLARKRINWESIDVNGPFYGVATGDLNNDGKKEIVVVSNESDNGYESSIIQVYDYQTNELLWQSHPDSLSSLTVYGTKSIEVIDIDKDGNNEIVVATDQWYDGRITIFDGVTKRVKKSYTFNAEDYGGFYGQKTFDVNNDGINEIIVANGNLVRIIDSRYFTTLFTSTISGGYYGYGTTIIEAGNIDNDVSNEIIVNNGTLNIIDVNTNQVWSSNKNDYSNIDLYDFNNDSRLDIIAGNNSGVIEVIDGVTKNFIFTFKVSNNKIDNIKMARIFSKVGSKKMVFSSDGRLYYFDPSDTTRIIQLTNSMGNSLGQGYSMKIEDLNSDGIDEIIIGDNYSVNVLPNNCNLCDSLVVQTNFVNPKCNQSNGIIMTTISGGINPAIHWFNGSNLTSISGLPAGVYSLTVTDNRQCNKNFNITLIPATIKANISVQNENCVSSLSGSIIIASVVGTPPIKYYWNNGLTTSGLANVSSGNYSLTISGNGDCPLISSFTVYKDSVKYTMKDLSCFGNQGAIELQILKGNSPFFVEISNISNSLLGSRLSVSGLPYKKQLLRITDNKNCSIHDSVNLIAPIRDIVNVTSFDDSLNTKEIEGRLNVSISGFNQPYLISIEMETIVGQNFAVFKDLPSKEYNVRVKNKNECIIVNNYTIKSIEKLSVIDKNKNENDFIVCPNPSMGDFSIEGRLPENSIMYIYDMTGKLMDLYEGQIKKITINRSGQYLMKIVAGKSIYNQKLTVE